MSCWWCFENKTVYEDDFVPMSIYISTSHRDASKMWATRGGLYDSVAAIIEARNPNDAALNHAVFIGGAVNGLSLERKFEENPTLALRLRDEIRAVALEIADGEHEEVFDIAQSIWPEEDVSPAIRATFANLAIMLGQWNPTTESRESQ